MSPPLSVIDIHHERKINIQIIQNIQNMDVDEDLVWFFPRNFETTDERLKCEAEKRISNQQEMLNLFLHRKFLITL